SSDSESDSSSSSSSSSTNSDDSDSDSSDSDPGSSSSDKESSEKNPAKSSSVSGESKKRKHDDSDTDADDESSDSESYTGNNGRPVNKRQRVMTGEELEAVKTPKTNKKRSISPQEPSTPKTAPQLSRAKRGDDGSADSGFSSGYSTPTAPKTVSVDRRMNTKKQKTLNERFSRINEKEVVYADDRLKDNTFTGKNQGVEGDYGYKAHLDLVVTRGKGFTKEKNKKKRGSYRGGKITTESHSIKFDSD
ncbi:jun-like transcription factor, partial [Spiromyces aspiralis]